MTGDTTTVAGSPLSISGVESVSDVESTFDLGDANSLPPKIIPSTLEAPEIKGLFDVGDGDILLVINGVVLETHKYLIKGFSVLKERLKDNTITLNLDEPGVEDFLNTFKILYASVIRGPFEFDRAVLTSALRLATTYDHPDLRDFALEKLGKIPLTAVERVWFARQFSISAWEEDAYVELCERNEAIGPAEATALGMDAFVQVARIRETEQRRKGEMVNASKEAPGGDTQRSNPKAESGIVNPTAKVAHGGAEEMGRTAASVVRDSYLNGEVTVGKGAKSQTYEKGEAESPTQPSFIDILGPDECQNYVSLLAGTTRRVPGCRCKTWSKTPSEGPDLDMSATWRCKLPPCAVSAIRYLQTQQLAHKNNLSKLETTIEQIQASHSPSTPVLEPRFSSAVQVGYVREEVRKWLARGKGPAIM